MDDAIKAQVAELIELGVSLCDGGQLAEAEELFTGLREVVPDDFQVNSRLGVLLATRGQYAAAIAPLRDAAASQGDPVVFNVLSACAFEIGDFPAALTYADAALSLARGFMEAYGSRGNALTRLGRDDEALEAFRAALVLDDRNPINHINIANALRNLGRMDKALRSLDHAIAAAPDMAVAHVNRGNVLQDLGRHREAIRSYDRAAELDPSSVDAHWNRTLCRLLIGEFQAGWRDYEWRWHRPVSENRLRTFATPLWLGQEPLAGRSILVHGEQGLGDCVQFARYIPQLAAMGARVTVEVYQTLVDLFGSLNGVEVVAAGAPLPDTDFQCPIMSLPLALCEDGPPAPLGAYLRPPTDRQALWADRAPAGGPLKVGLVCSGSATHGNDQRRSLPFETLSRHLPAGPAYHLLQKEIAPRDVEPFRARPDVTAWCDDLRDFSDTAALAERMDIVISVDTSVAHLAGALGRPTWVLLPYDPDWRWGLKSDRTPWYSSATLYRQTVRDDWTGVLKRLSADLVAAAPAG